MAARIPPSTPTATLWLRLSTRPPASAGSRGSGPLLCDVAFEERFAGQKAIMTMEPADFQYLHGSGGKGDCEGRDFGGEALGEDVKWVGDFNFDFDCRGVEGRS